MSLLDDDQIRQALDDLDGWTREGDALTRSFTFDGFRAAIAFIGRVADLADDANHHPEITNVYADVTLRLTSHDAGGITRRDVDLAAAVDRVVDPDRAGGDAGT